MALFKCLRSGNTVEIFQEDDIERMKGHEGYIRLDEPQPKGEDHGKDALYEKDAVAQDAVQAQPGQTAQAEVTVSVVSAVSAVSDVVAPEPVAIVATVPQKRGRPRKTVVAAEGVEI